MNKDVYITIRGATKKDEESFDQVVTKVRGSYHYRDGVHYISYEEPEENTDTVIKNLIKLTAISMEHTKKGTLKTCLSFEEDKLHETSYMTPFGELKLAVKTVSYEFKEEEDNLKAELTYHLFLNDESSGLRSISINIDSLG
ncbi:MAG: DUF1934 domain-containing protein [Lachnospiraceae bacterium]|nr:DUF1934 domain-containing protein [Lachnospiraceae bacterium]